MSGSGLRVLIVTPDFPPAPGGIQTLMGKLATYLPAAEVKVITLAGDHTGLERDGPGADPSGADPPGADPPGPARPGADRPPPEVVRVRLAATLPQARIATLSARALAEAVRFRPSVTLAGHVAVFGAVAAIRRLTGAPTALYVHAEEFRVWPRRTRQGVRSADAVIAVSRHSEHMALGAGAPRERMHRILHGVELPDEPSEPVSRRPGPPTVLTVARIAQPHKGHDVMLEAMARLAPRLPGLRWVVLGDGPLRAEYARRADRLGLAGTVSFLGAVSDAERNRWLELAHAFAMPSRLPEEGVGGEGFGIVFLEAAAHGLPVVAGDEGGALDAVDGERSALLVDPRDPAAVAAALERLLRDPELADRLGRAGYEWAARRSWPATARSVAGVLSELSR